MASAAPPLLAQALRSGGPNPGQPGPACTALRSSRVGDSPVRQAPGPTKLLAGLEGRRGYGAALRFRPWPRPARRGPRGHWVLARSSLGDVTAMTGAARQLVDDFVRSSMVVGVGGGTGSLMALEYLASKIKSGSLKEISIVPGSAVMASEAANYGIPMTTLEDLKLKELQVDLAIADADTIQEGTLYGVIGRRDVFGRGSLLKEKAIASAAKQFVVLVSADRFVERLEGSVPVEIQQFNWLETAEEVDDIFIGDAEVWRRPSSGEAGPMGGDFPFVTESGHFVLDLRFEAISKPDDVAKELGTVPGVVAHGVLISEVHAAAVAYPEGVKIRTSLFRNSFASP